MPEFQLFRLKVYPPKQALLFNSESDREIILVRTITSAPSAALRRGSIWHLGNVTRVDDHGLYFRVGRTARSTLGLYQDGRFEDAEFETAPYTHAVVDVNLEVLAVAKKAQLGPNAASIADRVERLLNEARSELTSGVRFKIDEISDPESLVTYIREAYTVSEFWLTVTQPNPFDENEDFVKPMQKALTASNGQRAKAEIRGTDLNREVLEELARSAASAGNDAGATLVPATPEGRKMRKRLRGNSVNVQEEELQSEDSRRDLLQRVRDAYNRVRAGSQE